MTDLYFLSKIVSSFSGLCCFSGIPIPAVDHVTTTFPTQSSRAQSRIFLTPFTCVVSISELSSMAYETTPAT